MSANFLLYIVFLSQIFVISYFLPRRLRQRASEIMSNHPVEQYPKLYPISVDKIHQKINQLMLLTYGVLVLGVLLVAHGLYTQSDEMLGWDSQSVITIYYMLQVIPLVLLAFFGERYFKKMRRVNEATIRRAQLSPRNITNYVSKGFIGLAVGVYVMFVLLVAYISEHPFDGFAGYVNVLGVTFLNVLFGLGVYKQVYGKKIDPHQNDEDRFNQSSRVVKLMLFFSMAATVNISINFLLSSLDLRHLNDVVASLYYQIIMMVMVLASVKKDDNFEVYKVTNE
jgi:hypothetical protein